jgi:hypothetical protein
MNPGIGHMTILINYQITWSQHLTPIALGKTNMLPTSTYPMWYNVIPPFVPLDPSLYLAYPIGIKRFDSSIFRNYIGYVLGNVYPVPKQRIVPPTYIPNFVGNKFPIVVQPVTSVSHTNITMCSSINF